MILSVEATSLWEQALALNRAAAAVSPQAGDLPPLMFFTDPERTPRPWETAARLPAGAAVVYRGFGRPEAENEARRLREATRGGGVRLLIGLDLELARAVEADGLHLPQRALPLAREAKAAGMTLVTGAAHDAAALDLGARSGLDAAILSPVFESASPSATVPLGIEALTRLVRRAPIPAYALGGITAANAHRLGQSGVCGVCAIEGIERAFG